MIKNLKNISRLILSKRLEHPDALSQTELASKIGYGNGQLISNIERGVCGVPLKKISGIANILKISEVEIKQAILSDLHDDLESIFSSSNLN